MGCCENSDEHLGAVKGHNFLTRWVTVSFSRALCSWITWVS